MDNQPEQVTKPEIELNRPRRRKRKPRPVLLCKVCQKELPARITKGAPQLYCCEAHRIIWRNEYRRLWQNRYDKAKMRRKLRAEGYQTKEIIGPDGKPIKIIG